MEQVGRASTSYDENLAGSLADHEDAFEPSLPLSVVVHIDYRKAPLVIQRFGDIKRLVEQTLDPMVSAYFKNIGQTRTLIQLIQDRSAIQQIAGEQMKEKFAQYNLELQEVLIGTPTSGAPGGQIEQILTQLRSRQIATEQVETYNRQEVAAVKERELRETEERARQQNRDDRVRAVHRRAVNQVRPTSPAPSRKPRRSRRSRRPRPRCASWGEGEAAKVKAIAGGRRASGAVGVAQAMAIESRSARTAARVSSSTQQVMNRFAEAIQVSKGGRRAPRVVGGGGAGAAVARRAT